MKQADPDHELIQQIQAGSEQAFNELVRRHQETVCRLACRRLGNKDEARDMAQEVFIKAYKVLPKWRYQAKFFTWIYQTTLNMCRTHKRKGYRLDYYETIPDHMTPPEMQSGYSNLARVEQIHSLRQSMRKLTERQHQVVLLRIYERLSIKDTAEIMKCRTGTVKALLSQAIQKLSLHLNKEIFQDELSC